MFRYIVVNSIFMVSIFIVLAILFRGINFRYSRLLKLVPALVVISIVFDNIIIFAGFVAYDPNHISGITLGRLPIEDLDYAVVTATLLPLLWEYPELRRNRTTSQGDAQKDKT